MDTCITILNATVLMVSQKKHSVLLTSTDDAPRKPKSCSLNGRPTILSAVSFKYLAMISFWYRELVATVIGYHTCTNRVWNRYSHWVLHLYQQGLEQIQSLGTTLLPTGSGTDTVTGYHTCTNRVWNRYSHWVLPL